MTSIASITMNPGAPITHECVDWPAQTVAQSALSASIALDHAASAAAAFLQRSRAPGGRRMASRVYEDYVDLIARMDAESRYLQRLHQSLGCPDAQQADKQATNETKVHQ
ncbi:MAG: hypothetical protein H5U28_10745 [Burkholderiaceae bacterium]|nr:hypothetical protein [Burkholderiaceae bacterium]